MAPTNVTAAKELPDWTLLSNHGHVLVCIAREPDVLLRDVAAIVGITERAAQRIVSDLEREGFVIREKVGRRNTYRINPDAPMRHPNESAVRVGDFLAVLSI